VKPWIVNASPLILLGKINRLDLLAGLPPSFSIPHAVSLARIGRIRLRPANSLSFAGGRSSSSLPLPLPIRTAIWRDSRRGEPTSPTFSNPSSRLRAPLATPAPRRFKFLPIRIDYKAPPSYLRLTPAKPGIPKSLLILRPQLISSTHVKSHTTPIEGC
jgi:hypothetical protein